MKLLIISWNFPPARGGIEEMMKQLFVHLSLSDEVTLLAPKVKGMRGDQTGIRRSPIGGLAGFLLWLCWRVPFEIFTQKKDVLLSSSAFVGSMVAAITILSKVPHAVLIHGTDIVARRPGYQLWLRTMLPKTSLLIANSNHTRREALARDLADESRIIVQHPGVDEHLPRDWVHRPETLPVPSDPVLLFVGRVIPRKGLLPFLEHCLPLILNRKRVLLWVIGGEPSASLAHHKGELGRIHQWLQGRAQEARVQLYGEVEDEVLIEAYRKAQVLIMPAVPVRGDLEGFGIVLLEAALFGVPAVATNSGGIPDAVIHGETGVIVEPFDWEAFASAVVSLLEDPELYRKLSAGAKRRAGSEFTWEVVAARCRQSLRRLTRNS